MNFRLLSSILTVLLFVWTSVAQSQIKARKDKSSLSQKVVSSKHYPILSVAYKDAVQFKLASRKSQYRLAEMLTIDAAMLNSFSDYLFLYTLRNLKFTITDEQGNQIKSIPYVIKEWAITSESFTLIEPNDFLTKSFDLLIGCDDRAFKQMSLTEDGNKTFFDNDLFLDWGNGCIDIIKPGVYTIRAEVENAYVVIGQSRSNKTATGNILSAPLRINIVN